MIRMMNYKNTLKQNTHVCKHYLFLKPVLGVLVLNDRTITVDTAIGMKEEHTNMTGSIEFLVF